jgi:hypothetical protein
MRCPVCGWIAREIVHDGYLDRRWVEHGGETCSITEEQFDAVLKSITREG